MQVSLTKQLEQMVQDRVSSGMYNNASEVVREALRKFFNAPDDALTSEEIARIREIVAPRLEGLDNGTAKLLDADEVFDGIKRKLARRQKNT